jgi:hypothetical protein
VSGSDDSLGENFRWSQFIGESSARWRDHMRRAEAPEVVFEVNVNDSCAIANDGVRRSCDRVARGALRPISGGPSQPVFHWSNRSDGFHNRPHWSLGRNSPFPQEVEAPTKGRSLQFLKSAGCIIVIDEPLDVSDPVGSVLISIKSMEGLQARSEINAHCCRSHAPST